MRLSAFAPAKINLFLHVGSAAPDGYHPVCSLMTFADVGDQLSIAASDHPDFAVDGPFAAALDDHGDSNLVMRATQALMARARGPQPPFRLLLTKMLPVAAGLGGGSSDAGAALRLVRNALNLSVADEDLQDLAAGLGADGPACFRAQPTIAEGRGEILSPAPQTPALDAVLVNPGVPCSTAAVYRAFDAHGGGAADRPGLPERFEDAQDAAAFLSYCRNDLEAPAAALVPEIEETLAALRGEPETLLARLSGSGATCFALCGSDIEAQGLAERLTGFSPKWWIKRCRLGGPWPD